MIVPRIMKIPVDIPVTRVMNRLGYRKNQREPDKKIVKLLDEEVSFAEGIIEPVSIYRCIPVQFEKPNKIMFNKELQVSSYKLFELLKKSFMVYAFALTIGDKLEKRVELLQKNGEISRALVLDAIGSETVDQSANIFHERIREQEMQTGVGITGRYSPGYGDWKLKDQAKLHTFLQSDKINISLTERYMMIPRKSVSAVFGTYRK